MQPLRAPVERAFIVGAYAPHGGTWMAYQLGRILHRDFGLPVVAVKTGAETVDHGIFAYDPEFPSMTMAEMENVAGPHDLLVCNPSFSKHHFGLKLPCRKLMYIQGFSTFSLLDRFFDHYVTVSDFVHDFVHAAYGLETPVIPPFVAVEPSGQAWAGRPVHSMLIQLKGRTGDQPLMLARLRDLIRFRAPEIEAAVDWEGGLLSASGPRPHAELMRAFGEARYLLTLSVGEGFGLVPLEAMAQGMVVLGFDGFGGRHYMQPGLNCATRPYPDLEGVATGLIEVMRDPGLGQALSDAARATAGDYGYERFRTAWTAEFKRTLGLAALTV